MELTPPQARVLGALVEKQLTTPQQYPLTLPALLSACNQTTNREPLVDYDEHTVTAAIDELKRLRLARSVLPSHGRTAVRYRHILDETLALDARQCAVLAVLLLRGPQTTGELRLRTERMAPFEGLDEVARELEYLATREVPLATDIGRRPGQKEERWRCPLVTPAGDAGAGAGPTSDDDVTTGTRTTAPPRPPSALDELRADLAALQSEVADLRRQIDDLRTSLGG
jgi:uncharacterized protein